MSAHEQHHEHHHHHWGFQQIGLVLLTIFTVLVTFSLHPDVRLARTALLMGAPEQSASRQQGLPRRPRNWNPAILVLCYNRPQYLRETLRALAELDGLQNYAVYVAQDGFDGPVAQVASDSKSVFSSAAHFEHWQNVHDPNIGGSQMVNAWISHTYKTGISHVFAHERNHSHVIVLEDDLVVSPDFLLYFEETAWLLDADPTLWCIDAWNDNGYYKGHDWDSKKLFRTSFFPGYGWMIKRETWDELAPHWDKGDFQIHGFDWGLRRLDTQSVPWRRECVCPELSRTRNIGKSGVHTNEEWHDRMMNSLAWSTVPVFSFGDLSYLLEPGYSEGVRRQVDTAIPLALPSSGRLPVLKYGETYLVKFTMDSVGWSRAANVFHIWNGDLRGHFYNLVTFPWRGATVILAEKNLCPFINGTGMPVRHPTDTDRQRKTRHTPAGSLWARGIAHKSVPVTRRFLNG